MAEFIEGDAFESDVEDETSSINEDEEGMFEFLSARKKEFERDREADHDNRKEAYDDIQFIALPETQWLDKDREDREKKGRPCPSLNRLQPFLKGVANGVRRMKPEINLSPVEGDDKEESDLFEGIINQIERNSSAAKQYSAWCYDGVNCGIGHVRGIVEPSPIYDGQMQLRMEHIPDPLSVVWDFAANNSSRRDARRAWVIDYLPKDEIDDDENYPDAIGDWPSEGFDAEWSDWIDGDSDEIRVVEYYAVKYRSVTEWVHVLTREKRTLNSSEEAPDGFIKLATKKEKYVCAWLLTAGKILEGGLEGLELPGTRIPIFPYIPSETRLGRKKVRKGLVRDAKDSVRMINWAMALMIEAMAATPKPKWIGPQSAFEGFEEDWDQAAITSRPWIPYSDKAKAPPVYQQPPPFNVGLVNAMQVFDENIKQITGIYDASLGARSNETSGTAIRAREEQGDTATYDFVDEFNNSIEELGKWFVEVIPDVYTDERAVEIVGENNKPKTVTINGYDPATGEHKNPIARTHFDVVVKAGPGFATMREEAAQMFERAMQAAPQLAPILLDLVMEMQDWPGADRAAKRLSEMLPPEIKALESGEPMPQPQQAPPDPSAVASAQKDMASAKKINAEAEQISLETKINQIQAILSGLPPQLFATPMSGNQGNSAPQGNQPPVPFVRA